ncbi:hypothetical protein FACS1894172_02290 [Spirochaetia bacterium]|nr:hypothetical protein FACS1894172_02290 [Spirochaetia bacterium]
MKKLSLLVVMCVVVNGLLFAEEIKLDPFEMPTTRSLALGGSHAAYTWGPSALFDNPAELRSVKGGSILGLNIGLYDPPFLNKLALLFTGDDPIDFDNDASGATSRILEAVGGGALAGLDIRGPLSFGFVAGGFGLGINDRIYTKFQFYSNGDIDLKINADVVVNAGYAFRLIDSFLLKVDAGFAAKAFGRVRADVDTGILPLLPAVSGNGDIVETLLKGQNIPLIAGAGVDLGATVRLFNDIAISLVYRDIYSAGKEVMSVYGDADLSDTTYRVPSTLALGASYKFRLGSLLSLAVMADYKDFIGLFEYLDEDKRLTLPNPLLQMSVGAEVGFFNDLLFVRAGLNELNPAVGLGLNLKVFKIDAALYGKELGLYRGHNPSWAFDLGLNFGW